MLKNVELYAANKLFTLKYTYDIIKIPRGYDIFSIKPTKDIKRGANIVYVLNTYHR